MSDFGLFSWREVQKINANVFTLIYSDFINMFIDTNVDNVSEMISLGQGT